MNTKVNACFKRVAPTEQTELMPLGWFAISHRYIEDKKTRRMLHGEWCKIKSAHGTIYRVLRFSPRLKGNKGKDGQILLDWNGYLDLSDHATQEVEVDLEITLASRWSYFQLSLSHPDPTYRHNSVLALIGVGLGVISLIVTFM